MLRWPLKSGSVARLQVRLPHAAPLSPAWAVGPPRAGSCHAPSSWFPSTIHKMQIFFFTFIFSFSHVLANMQAEIVGYERTLHLTQRQALGVV